MAARSSQQDQEEIVWQTVSLPLGIAGLDLRNTANAVSLNKLLNARFDADRIVRRNGYRGVHIRDASDFPITVDGSTPKNMPMTGNGWVYGHGQVFTRTNPLLAGTSHMPEPGVARGTFRLGDQDVVWTGDRLLVARDDGSPALGDSTFWKGFPTNKYGIPCFLPVQVDSTPPDAISGDYVEHCVTETLAVTVTGGTTDPTAWVVDRSTGALINESSITGDGNSRDLRVFQSGSWVVLLWRTSALNLYSARWTGSGWSAASLVRNNVYSYDVCLEEGGFHVVWHENDGGTRKLFAGHYVGYTGTNTPYQFRTQLATTDAPTGPMAAAIDSAGRFCAVWAFGTVLKARTYSASLVAGTEAALDSDTGFTWDGIAVCARTLSTEITGGNLLRWTVFASPTSTKTRSFEFLTANSITKNNAFYNARLASRAFVVGNETFAWLHATNSNTLFLVGGVGEIPQRCGIADREIAKDRVVNEGVRALAQVTRDPLNEYTYIWARPFNTGAERERLTGTFATGLTYVRGGNVLIGSLNFMPKLSAAQYGASVYIAGSLVRNWDGVQLGDAGWHDYPIVSATDDPGGTGSLDTTAGYQYRVYAVRYNSKGERFESAAITKSASTTGAQTKIRLTINTVPVTNHDDVVFEVYRTEGGQTTFYYEGSVANSLTGATVTFVSEMADAALSLRKADEHATGVGSQNVVEDFGPIGCSFLASGGDRLWGGGGQVPGGWVQFSKLKTNAGAGFDALGGAQQVDTEGGQITSVAIGGDAVFVSLLKRIYLLFGSGPSNFGTGGFTAQIVLTDGASVHSGTIVTSAGIAYWGADGPRILTTNLRVENISLPIKKLTKTLTPTGVQVNTERGETVWFTDTGTAVLWNYAGKQTRWAQWTGLKVAGCSEGALVTTDCRLLYEDEDAYGDDGAPFTFAGASNNIDFNRSFGASTELRSVGIVGEYHGPHQLRMKIYYNGSPMWGDRWAWRPDVNTGLMSGEELAGLTGAQVDALKLNNRAGGYATHHRASRHECRYFKIEWTDISSARPTYTPYEITLEVGARGGMGRVSIASFGD